jgi:HK97 family phage major capsid protein
MIEDNLKSLPVPVQEAMRDAYKSYKATFTTTGLTNYDRPSGIVLQGVMMPHVADLIPQGETGAPTIRYQREVSFTPSATAVAEGALKPEAVWSVGEVDAPVRKIAVIARTTEELLEDYPAFRDYVNQRTPFMVQIEEDNQLLNGNGTAPNLRGILNTSGILTHAMGMDVDETTAVADDTAPDAILRGITRVQAESYFVPTANVLNPFDWMRIRLLRSGTGDAAGGAGRGVYLFGPPSEPGVQTLWGLVNVLTTRIAQLTVLSGAFNVGAQIFRRKGLTVEMTNTDGEDWRYNRVAIRAEQREALAVYLPQAFVRTTLT